MPTSVLFAQSCSPGTCRTNGAIYTLQYDLLNDFEPIALLPSTPLMILTNNTLPVNDLKELIAWLKANQDRVSYGTSGTGSWSPPWSERAGDWRWTS